MDDNRELLRKLQEKLDETEEHVEQLKKMFQEWASLVR